MKVPRQISNSGIYLLEFYVENDIELENIKKFRGKKICPGFYYYAGSAQKNLVSRLNRHIKKEKKIHWHIDHLSSHTNSRITKVFIAENAPRSLECELANYLNNTGAATFFLDNFGNGDCNSCGSHLLKADKPVDYNHLLSLYHFTTSLIPSSSDISCFQPKSL